jgi:hypothetical protein
MRKVYEPEDCIWKQGERVVLKRRFPQDLQYPTVAEAGDTATVLGARRTPHPMLTTIRLDTPRHYGTTVEVTEDVLAPEPEPL